MADITERLEKTYQLLKSQGGSNFHPSNIQDGINEITQLRERIRILEHEKESREAGENDLPTGQQVVNLLEEIAKPESVGEQTTKIMDDDCEDGGGI